MSPRAGGEADKFGNRYEGAWTVRHLLYVLLGAAESITVEDVGAIAEGAEFTYRRAEGVEVHQLKRQHGTANTWTIRSLQAMGIWRIASGHAEAGREFHFVSTLPSQVLQELCDKARRSGSVKALVDDWLTNEPLQRAFTELASPTIFGSAGAAWKALNGIWIRWPDERDVVQENAVLAGLLLEGSSGRLASIALGDMVQQNLGVELTATRMAEELPAYGLRFQAPTGVAAIAEKLHEVTSNWSDSIQRELLRPAIAREEAAQLMAEISEESKLVFVVGTAGSGKSAVLSQAVEQLSQVDTPALAFRLDRLEPFSSTEDLGAQLGLDLSPVAALASVAQERLSVLLIDQLDAVSLVSGRMPRNFDSIANLVREAAAFPKMKLVLSCRQFDLNNDDRIRDLAVRSGSRTLTLGPLGDAQVDSSVQSMGLDSSGLLPAQRELLRSPLHLVLLATVASEPGALNFRTIGNLFDAYWDRKRREVTQRRAGTRFEPVISALAEAISARQRLSVPASVLDTDDLAVDAEILVSEHVLVRDGREVAFFHESFFDYAFARRWVSRSESLVAFLLSGEQELFRRAQVRQILIYLREADQERFVEEVRGVLASDRVRFHVQDAVLSVISGLEEPTTQELEMLLSLQTGSPLPSSTLWERLRSQAWFERLDADGQIAEWLSNRDKHYQERAWELIVGVVNELPDRVVQLLSEVQGDDYYSERVRWVLRYAALNRSRALFDLFVNAVLEGMYAEHEHDMWLSSQDLIERPDWAIEFLSAFFVRRPGALELNTWMQVAALMKSDNGAKTLMAEVGQRSPKLYCEALLPYLLEVMEVTASETDGDELRADRHFSYRFAEQEYGDDLGESLLAGLVTAMAVLAKNDPDSLRTSLELLANNPHQSAQWLLYQGFIAGGASYAEWAAEVLLQGRKRLLCGYGSHGVWVTRQLLQTISPHLKDESIRRLEKVILDVQFTWEPRRGMYSFALLDGLEEHRLSEMGWRRLGELRRSMGMQHPLPPEGLIALDYPPPISKEDAKQMSDDNWLRAIEKYRTDDHDRTANFGGASELSAVLRECVKEEPARYAHLALRLTRETNPSYTSAILWGLGEAGAIGDEEGIINAIRYLSSIGHTDNDRWIGWSLRSYLKTAPLDIIQLVLERALNSEDPHHSDSENGGAELSSADIRSSGFNTGRGALAEALAGFLKYDVDGSRTEVVAPYLAQLAEDPAVPVRASVAYLIYQAMRHARTEGKEAFWRLVETEDILLAADSVKGLIILLGSEEPATVYDLLTRMVTSEQPTVRRSGGQLAAYAAMEWGFFELLESIKNRPDEVARSGAALECAQRLPWTSSASVASTALARFLFDSHEEVQAAAATFVSALRGLPLRPHERDLRHLIMSPSFKAALPQLLMTLERAPDRVDDLALLCAQRFVHILGPESRDLRTRAAGEARGVGELVIRGIAQSRARQDRAALLDVLDEMLKLRAYGIEKLIDSAER